ncbi:MAG: ParB/RepB/Spo0J family partition protein [Ruminococcus sp.]|nr:ParB/RepB/Spo0J family partition protein [Ruminococcus sp.]
MSVTIAKERPINTVVEIEVSRIIPDASRRIRRNDGNITALAASIAENGVVQPISVRRNGDFYVVISGHKRLRAAKMLGLEAVPCIIHSENDNESEIISLVEHIKRQELSIFDEAEAIQQLISFYGITQEDAASRLGKAQSTIANKLRLLRLTVQEREIIMNNGLTERHARALLRLASPDERKVILETVVSERLNVDRTERLIEEYIDNKGLISANKKENRVVRSVRSLMTTINKAVETMQAAGISAEAEKKLGDDQIEYRITIPMNEKNQ